MKLDLGDVTDAVNGWDEELPDILHNKWIKNFFRMEKLKGLSLIELLCQRMQPQLSLL